MRLTVSQNYFQFLTGIGINFKSVMELAGLPDSTWKEELNLSTLEYYQLLEAFDKVATEEQILSMSRLKDIQMFMPPFFAALSSKNGWNALKHFAKYKKITGPIIVEIETFDDLVRVSYRFDYAGMELPKFALLNEQALLVDLLRTGTGEQITPVHVASPYSYGETVEEFFGVTVEKAEVNELVFRMSDLEKPFITANNLMLEYLEPQLKERLVQATVGDSFTGIVQQKLYQSIPSGAFTIEDIAESLGISSRTLQRNLNAEGTKFNTELQTVQKMLALSYLKNNQLPTEEVSFLLGYSEVSSFARAFKKWTGKTITEYRNEN